MATHPAIHRASFVIFSMAMPSELLNLSKGISPMTYQPATHIRSKRRHQKTACGYFIELRGLRERLPVTSDPASVTCGRCKRLAE